jgi:hypothetical protein
MESNLRGQHRQAAVVNGGGRWWSAREKEKGKREREKREEREGRSRTLVQVSTSRDRLVSTTHAYVATTSAVVHAPTSVLLCAHTEPLQPLHCCTSTCRLPPHHVVVATTECVTILLPEQMVRIQAKPPDAANHPSCHRVHRCLPVVV